MSENMPLDGVARLDLERNEISKIQRLARVVEDEQRVLRGIGFLDFEDSAEDENAVVVDKQAFLALWHDLAHYDDRIRRALNDFGWAAERALGRLRRAVR
jgi:hypothetical protein